jgi:hypothetical protein
VYAQLQRWTEAGRDFERAFQVAPELEEARRNWTLVRAAAERGALVSGQWRAGGVTLVVADPSHMTTATAWANDMVQARTGVRPFVTTNASDAVARIHSGPVILQVPDGGLRSVAGDGVLRQLNAVGGRAPVNVITYGHQASTNAVMGGLRHLNTAPAATQTRVNSVQMVDYSEVAGAAGKTPLAVTDLNGLARLSSSLISKGVPVAGFTVMNKPGVQHMGNVRAFQQSGVEVYATPWRGGVQTSLGVGPRAPFIGPSVSITNATDAAGSRIAPTVPRDWVVYRGSSNPQYMTGTLSDLGKQYIGSAPPSPRPPTISSSPGGIWLGPVDLARDAGGRVAFRFGEASTGELKVVRLLFGSSSSVSSLKQQR